MEITQVKLAVHKPPELDTKQPNHSYFPENLEVREKRYHVRVSDAEHSFDKHSQTSPVCHAALRELQVFSSIISELNIV